MTEKILCLVIIGISLLCLIVLYIKRVEKHKKDAVKVLFLTGCLGLLVCITESENRRLDAEGRLRRNEAGESSDSEDLQLNVEGLLEDYNYTVEIEAQKLQGEARELLFETALQEAENRFIGENQSLDYIQSDVSLPQELQNGQIQAAWGFAPEGFIDAEGRLDTENLEKDGQLIMVSLILSYDNESRNYSFGCMLYPPPVNKRDQLLQSIAAYFEQENQNQENSEYLQLPKKLEGYVLNWSQKAENTYQMILLLGVFAAVLVYANHWVKAQKQEETRRQELLHEYPDMVSKLSLLLGAGMTLSGAWERIVLNYRRQLEQKLTERTEVYEQMLLSYREMQDGVGELKVYERFGERCGIPQYRKLTTIINQNLRKGSAGLTDLLEKEVSEAFALRKNYAKKAGEEAGTKLLLPMVLMLCIVMVIVIVPAIVSFQM